jgi:predicted dithiol-disulfide oxidoreductase (DUF899 family)
MSMSQERHTQTRPPGSLHDARFPNESAAYRRARDALLVEELALRRQAEAVAARRRALPPGGPVREDYVFEGESGPVRLSELFGQHRTLITYHYMFGPERERPCASCTSLLSGIDGILPDLTRRVAFVAIARSPVARLLAFRRERGWRNLRLVSDGANSFAQDYFGYIQGNEVPIVNVFTRGEDGEVRHFWGNEMGATPSEPGQDSRDNDNAWPLWTLLDNTPEGRGTNWYPKLEYTS